MSSNSKGGGAAASQSYDFHGSIAVAICSGPVDTLTGIEIDDDLVYTTTLNRATSTNPVAITIPGRGVIDFFWGTDDQLTTHPILLATGNSQSHRHPAYTGLCYAVLNRFLFGRERTSAPNVRFHVRRRPKQSLITGPAAELVDGQANPFAVLAELATSERFGRARPVADFHQASWQAAADAAYARAADCYISTHLDRQVNGLTYARDMFTLCDGFLRIQFGTTLAEAGVMPRPESIVPGSLPLIDSAALTAPPEWQPETWEDVITRVTVSYIDRANNFKERTVRHEDPRAAVIVEEARSIDLERKFIGRAEQAQNHAIEYSRRRAIPGLRGSVTVRPARAASLRVGQHIRLDIDPEPGGLRLEKVCRILRIERPATGPVTLDVEGERTLAPVAFIEPTIPEGPVAQPVPDIAHARLFEVSPPLAGDADFHVGILAERPGDIVTDCTVLYDTADETDSLYPPLGAHRAYALRARLNEAYGAVSSDLVELEIELLGTRDRELVATNPGLVAARNDTLLMIVFKPVDTGGGGYRLPYEIFSVNEITTPANNLLNVSAFRQRLGTAPLAHAIGAEVWFIPRETLPIYTHRDFPSKASNGELAYFKLQPSSFFAVRPLDDVVARSFRFDSVRAYAPQIAITSPVNDAGKDYVTLPTNGSLTIAGTVTDADSNLIAIRIYRSNPDGSQETLLDRNLTPTSTTTLSLPVSFPSDGNCVLTIQAEDSSARIVQKQIVVIVGAAVSGRLSIPRKDEIFIEEDNDAETGIYYQSVAYSFSYPDAAPVGSNIVLDLRLGDYTQSQPPASNFQTSASPLTGSFYEITNAYNLRYFLRARDLNSIYTPSDWVFYEWTGNS